MPVSLGVFARPNTASIFAGDPVTRGKIVAFLLQNIAVPVPGRVRLDLLHQHTRVAAFTAARSPVERIVADNIRKEPERFTIQGSLSANPLGPLSAILGSFGDIVRRDLREVEKLHLIANRKEPVILVTPARVYPPACMSITESHDGTNKVELSLAFEEVRIVSPLSLPGVLDLNTVLAGSQAKALLGAQATAAVPAPQGMPALG